MHQNTAQMLIAGTILVASHAVILAQDVASMPWNVEDELWETSSDLWEHEKYSNALFGYEDWLSEQTNLEDTRCAIAQYRIAFCAIQLQQNDASRRVETFFSNYPENPLGQKIQWELAPGQLIWRRSRTNKYSITKMSRISGKTCHKIWRKIPGKILLKIQRKIWCKICGKICHQIPCKTRTFNTVQLPVEATLESRNYF